MYQVIINADHAAVPGSFGIHFHAGKVEVPPTLYRIFSRNGVKRANQILPFLTRYREFICTELGWEPTDYTAALAEAETSFPVDVREAPTQHLQSFGLLRT